MITTTYLPLWEHTVLDKMQGAIPQMECEHIIQILCLMNNNDLIKLLIYTCCDYSGVMMYAKFETDWIIAIWIKVKRMFSRFQIHKPLMKYVPGHICCPMSQTVLSKVSANERKHYIM